MPENKWIYHKDGELGYDEKAAGNRGSLHLFPIVLV